MIECYASSIKKTYRCSYFRRRRGRPGYQAKLDWMANGKTREKRFPHTCDAPIPPTSALVEVITISDESSDSFSSSSSHGTTLKSSTETLVNGLAEASDNTSTSPSQMTVPDEPIGPPVDMSQQMADETDKLAVIHISHPAPEIWDMIREEFTAPGKITRGLSREQVISRVYRARHNHFGGSIYGQVEVPPLSLARDGSNFFQFNFTFPGETGPDRLIGWGHPALVRLLTYDNVSLFLDATFRCVPASFYQCIVVMVYDRGSRCYVPCVTILSTTKTEWFWRRALHGVQVCTKMSMQPGTITCDYERAVLNAARDQFPESTTVGCLFHFKQAVRRRMQKLYIPTEEISVAMRRHMLDILTVLPHDQIDPQGIEHVVALIKEALAEKESTYSEAKWTQFWDYFRRTWIVQIPPHLWNVRGIDKRIVNRTNNPLERYNRELNGSFSTPRPNLANFVGVIEKHSHYYVTLLEDIARGRARAPVHGDYFVPPEITL
ncbi:hypothetical protein P3T76_014158 [Phytophthora citrophthora]|uniref:MULE transposase domain-containing protein n=1 Tax=Phytophthora citrophthora TaxID=4793 RepID=A0AAD9LCI0_9STRA|nr:hypothetical protein P3T76_014158 [Phytophthora citrophthora]